MAASADPPDPVAARLAELAARHALPDDAPARLRELLQLVEREQASITSVRDPALGVDVHVADSLAALDVPAVRAARSLVDLGSGGGFPGLALAVALPAARVALVESVERKCRFLRAAATALGLPHVEIVQERAETYRAGADAFDVATARALAPLAVVVEYAAPLLVPGGTLVAWKGASAIDELADGAAAAAALAMSAPRRLQTAPFAGARQRDLYVCSRIGPLPPGFPRRPGMARKRPLRA